MQKKKETKLFFTYLHAKRVNLWWELRFKPRERNYDLCYILKFSRHSYPTFCFDIWDAIKKKKQVDTSDKD